MEVRVLFGAYAKAPHLRGFFASWGVRRLRVGQIFVTRRYAERSRRRADAATNLEHMIEAGISDELRVVSVARTAA